MSTRNRNRNIAWTAGGVKATQEGRGILHGDRPATEGSDDSRPAGLYVDMREAVAALRKERQQAGLSLTEVSKRSGIDLAALSRLENGRHLNPTLETLSRYAAAMGKQFLWLIKDLPSAPEAAPAEEAGTVSTGRSDNGRGTG